MSSFLAIDFGERRTGVATGNVQAALVSPLTVVERRSDAQLIDELTALAAEHEAELLVLGLPEGVDGEERDAALRVRSFARKLESRAGLSLHLVGEALTTAEARSRIASGLSSAPLDAVAAQVIGEQYLAAAARRKLRRTPLEGHDPCASYS